MKTGDKLDRILEKVGIPMDHTVKDEHGHEYRAWPPDPSHDIAAAPAQARTVGMAADASAPDAVDEPKRVCPYQFEPLRSGRQRLTIKHPNGDIYAATGQTNAECVDNMAERMGITFKVEGKVDGQ